MIMHENRFNESGREIPFRTGRFFQTNNAWWFAIRRGPDQGPYNTQESAKVALVEYLNDMFVLEGMLMK